MSFSCFPLIDFFFFTFTAFPCYAILVRNVLVFFLNLYVYAGTISALCKGISSLIILAVSESNNPLIHLKVTMILLPCDLFILSWIPNVCRSWSWFFPGEWDNGCIWGNPGQWQFDNFSKWSRFYPISLPLLPMNLPLIVLVWKYFNLFRSPSVNYKQVLRLWTRYSFLIFISQLQLALLLQFLEENWKEKSPCFLTLTLFVKAI